MRRIVGLAFVVAGLLGLVLIFGLFNMWMDRAYNAWAYANPPLARMWEGEADAGSARLKLTLVLTRDEFSFFDYGDGDSQDSHRSLSGRAMLCDSTGRRQSYSFRGVVSDRRAEKTLLIFTPPPDEVPGLRPERMQLRWDGGIKLSGEGELARALATGGTVISSADPVTGHAISFLFHPASDLACKTP